MTSWRTHSKELGEKWGQDPGSWAPGIWFCSSVLIVWIPPALAPCPILSIPQLWLYVLLFYLSFQSLSDCSCPLFSPSSPNLGWLASNVFCRGLSENKVLLSVRTFPLGKLLPSWNSVWAPASKRSYVILCTIFLLCLVAAPSDLKDSIPSSFPSGNP